MVSLAGLSLSLENAFASNVICLFKDLLKMKYIFFINYFKKQNKISFNCDELLENGRAFNGVRTANGPQVNFVTFCIGQEYDRIFSYLVPIT
jgi:hypothetical protein